MTTDDIVNYYLENSQPHQTSSEAVSLNLPIIDSWICIDTGRHLFIHGMLLNHPQHFSGKRIRTSSIQDYISKANRVYVTTQNSIYQLGAPHPQNNNTDPIYLKGKTDGQEHDRHTYHQ